MNDNPTSVFIDPKLAIYSGMVKRTEPEQVEYVPKKLLDDCEKNYREMFKTMTASVAGKDKIIKIAIAALKNIPCGPHTESDDGHCFKCAALDELCEQ